MCLMWAIIEGNEKRKQQDEQVGVLDEEAIAKYYGLYMNSNPCCIGTTT